MSYIWTPMLQQQHMGGGSGGDGGDDRDDRERARDRALSRAEREGFQGKLSEGVKSVVQTLSATRGPNVGLSGTTALNLALGTGPGRTTTVHDTAFHPDLRAYISGARADILSPTPSGAGGGLSGASITSVNQRGDIQSRNTISRGSGGKAGIGGFAGTHRDSGSNIAFGVNYGIIAVEFKDEPAYRNTGQVFAGAGEKGNIDYHDFILPMVETPAGRDSELLVIQHAIALGDIQDVTYFLMDRDPMYADRFRQSDTRQNYWVWWQIGGQPPHPYIQEFSPERNDSAVATDITNVSFALWNATSDRRYRGEPRRVTYFVLGNPTSDIERFGTPGNYDYRLTASKAFSNKPVSALIDYWSSTKYGPQEMSVDNLDLKTFYTAQEINDDTWHYNGTLWNIPFPSERNQLPGFPVNEKVATLPSGITNATGMSVLDEKPYVFDADNEMWNINVSDTDNATSQALPSGISKPVGAVKRGDELIVLDSPASGRTRIWKGPFDNPSALREADVFGESLDNAVGFELIDKRLQTIVGDPGDKEIRALTLFEPGALPPDGFPSQLRFLLSIPNFSPLRGADLTAAQNIPNLRKNFMRYLSTENAIYIGWGADPGSLSTYRVGAIWKIVKDATAREGFRYQPGGIPHNNLQNIVDMFDHKGQNYLLRNTDRYLEGTWELWRVDVNNLNGTSGHTRVATYQNDAGMFEMVSVDDVLYARSTGYLPRSDINRTTSGKIDGSIRSGRPEMVDVADNYGAIQSKLHIIDDTDFSIDQTLEIFGENVRYAGLSNIKGELCIFQDDEWIIIDRDDNHRLVKYTNIAVHSSSTMEPFPPTDPFAGERLPSVTKATGWEKNDDEVALVINQNEWIGASVARRFGGQPYMNTYNFSDGAFIRKIPATLTHPVATSHTGTDMVVANAPPTGQKTLYRLPIGTREYRDFKVGEFERTHPTSNTNIFSGNIIDSESFRGAMYGLSTSEDLILFDSRSPRTAGPRGKVQIGSTAINGRNLAGHINKLYATNSFNLVEVNPIQPEMSTDLGRIGTGTSFRGNRDNMKLLSFRGEFYLFHRPQISNVFKRIDVWRLNMEDLPNSTLIGRLPERYFSEEADRRYESNVDAAFVYRNKMYIVDNHSRRVWETDPDNLAGTFISKTLSAITSTPANGLIQGGTSNGIRVFLNVYERSPYSMDMWEIKPYVDDEVQRLPAGMDDPRGLGYVGGTLYGVDADSGLTDLYSLAGRRFYDTYGEYIEDVTEISATNTIGLDIDRRGKFNDHEEVEILRRHRFNGNLATTNPYILNINQIISMLPGAIMFRANDDKWKLSMPDPKLPTSPVMIIDSSNLMRGTQVEVKEPDLNDRINRVVTRFSNIELDFALDTIEFPRKGSVLDEQLQGIDQGLELLVESDLIGGIDRYQAYAFSSNLIITSRRESYTFTCSTECYLLEPGDIVRLTVPWMDIDVYVRIYEKIINPNYSMSFTGSRYSRWDNDLYLTDTHPLPLIAESIGDAPPPVSPDPDPVPMPMTPRSASAPSISINNIVRMNEEETEDFTVTLSGGVYDNLSYAWTVESGGGSISGTGATATYTAPAVTEDTNAEIKCTVTATGTGTRAENGTSDTAEATEIFTIVNVPEPMLPNPPLNLRERRTSSDFFWVQWSAPATGGPTINSIVLRWSREQVFDSSDPSRTFNTVGSGSGVITGLQSGVWYVQVFSVGDEGEAGSNVLRLNLQ